MKKVITLLLVTLVWSVSAFAQFPYGTTGLLHMPTADMQRDKTFMAGVSFLDTEATPKAWPYDTYNYYINITIFPFLEIGYTCTLNKGRPGGYWPEQTWGKFVNQDRQFSGRLRVWKEGWWKTWTPQIVVGANDPSTNDKTPEKGYGVGGVSSTGNGAWNRYYVAATKHVDFPNIGNLGVHAAYVYNKRIDYHLNGPALGANFRFELPETNLLNKVINGLDLRAEYDSRTVNIGGQYSFWKDYINAVVELNQCRYPSAGVLFKVHLK